MRTRPSTVPAPMPYAGAVRLDRCLGDPTDAVNPYGFAAAVLRDERELPPEAMAAWARAAGLHLSFVPTRHGGTLTTFDETLMLTRMVARRDLAVMPATMFSITAVTAVLARGTADQRRRVIDIAARGGTVAFALSESEHGSDLLANDCRITTTAGGLRLDGNKWMVGLGDNCDALLLVGRTGRSGPGAFSAVLLDAGDLPAAVRDAGGGSKAVGMRGIGLAELHLDGVQVGVDALVGRSGTGMEAAMTAMHVVRVTSTAANLACADTALRTTVDFADAYLVRGRPLITQPAVRRELAAAFTALAICDVAALTAARALHAAPQWAPLWSAVVKRVATELSDEVFRRCADVLGTRSVLRDGPAAVFQKARRDNDVVRFVDTSPTANLRLVAGHLPMVFGPGGKERDEVPAAAFDLRLPLPEYDPAHLPLGVRGTDPVTGGLADAPATGLLGTWTDRIRAEIRRLGCDVAQLRSSAAAATPTAWLDLADRFCWLHAAAGCVQFWRHNTGRSLFGRPAGDTGWLVGCLEMLLARAYGTRGYDGDVEQRLAPLVGLHRDGSLFSAVPLPLAESLRRRDRPVDADVLMIGPPAKEETWPASSS